MSNLVQYRSPGDGFRIGASEWNAIGNVVNRFRQQINGQSGAGYPSPNTYEQSLRVQVKNNTGGTVLERGIVGIGSHVIDVSEDPADNENNLLHNAVTPSAGAVIGVLQQQLTDGEIGQAVVSGLVLCSVNVTDSAHGYCNSTTSTTVLTSGATGSHRIVWKESGTGTKWAVVLLGQRSPATADDIVDTSYDVRGLIGNNNAITQHLGKGAKAVDSFRIGAGNGSGYDNFTYLSLTTTPEGSGLQVDDWISTGKIQVSEGVDTSGTSINNTTRVRLQTYRDGTSDISGNYGAELRCTGNGSTYSLLVRIRPGLLDFEMGIGVGQIIRAGKYQARYGSTIYTGDNSEGYAPTSGTNKMGGVMLVGGLYIGGDFDITQTVGDMPATRVEGVKGGTDRAVTFAAETI